MLPSTSCFLYNTITLQPHILWSDSGIFPAEIQSVIRVHESVGKLLSLSLEDISSKFIRDRIVRCFFLLRKRCSVAAEVSAEKTQCL